MMKALKVFLFISIIAILTTALLYSFQKQVLLDKINLTFANTIFRTHQPHSKDTLQSYNTNLIFGNPFVFTAEIILYTRNNFFIGNITAPISNIQNLKVVWDTKYFNDAPIAELVRAHKLNDLSSAIAEGPTYLASMYQKNWHTYLVFKSSEKPNFLVVRKFSRQFDQFTPAGRWTSWCEHPRFVELSALCD